MPALGSAVMLLSHQLRLKRILWFTQQPEQVKNNLGCVNTAVRARLTFWKSMMTRMLPMHRPHSLILKSKDMPGDSKPPAS